jgi:hypothetical protein
MARLAPARARVGRSTLPLDGTSLAFRYLYTFRRVVVGLAILGAVVAWAEQWPGLFAAFVCVGIGELLESSYYIGVLRWQQRHDPRAGFTAATVSGSDLR